MQQKRRLITRTIDTNHAEILGCVLLFSWISFGKKGVGFLGPFFNVGFQTVPSFQSQKNLSPRVRPDRSHDEDGVVSFILLEPHNCHIKLCAFATVS